MDQKYRIEFDLNNVPHEFVAVIDKEEADSEPVIMGKILDEIRKEIYRLYKDGHVSGGVFKDLRVYEPIPD